MRNIVVIGGGFAGTTTAKYLEHHLSSEWQVMLLSEENYMVYTPLLPEVVGASLLPAHTVAPIRKILRRAKYFRARVQEIDLLTRSISFHNNKTHTLSYEHLVLAIGKVPNMSFIEGMAENAMPLKTVGDALHIRNQIIISLEQAELESDPELRRQLLTVIVIGGGSSGVEVAGSVADFMQAAKKYYPVMHEITPRVIILESAGKLLSEFPGSLGDSAMKLMQNNNIDIRLNTVASQISEDGVKINDNEWLQAKNIICTIGTVSNELVGNLKLPDDKGLIKTNNDMSVFGVDGVWAIGDCAAIVNKHNEQLSPPTAQFAVRQGKQAGKNIVRKIKGKKTRPFNYHSRGQFATIGHRRAVAHMYGIKLSGFPAWLIWRAVYLLMLPTWVRKLEVFSAWNLELLFPRDITQLHLARTKPPQKQKSTHQHNDDTSHQQ